MTRTIKQSCVFAILVAFGFLAAIAASGQESKKNEKVKYEYIEVANFDVKEGLKFPEDFMKPMMDEIVSKLVDLRKFKQVMRTGDTQTDASAPALQLVGTVTEFKAGSRAKRYLISLGAGKTKIVTHIKFIDKSTGNVLYEGYASGGVSWGIFGGNSKEAVNGVGKQIADAAKKEFF